MSSGELQRDWDLSVESFETNDGPIYFCNEKILLDPSTRDVVTAYDEGGGGHQLHGGTDKLTATFDTLFPSSVAFAFTAYNPGDVSQTNVKNAIDLERLKAELTKRKPPRTEFVSSYGFIRDDSCHFERGVLLVAPKETAKEARQFVNDISTEFGQAGYFEYEVKDGRVVQYLVSVPSQEVKAESVLVQVCSPSCHPAFIKSEYHSVFHDVAKLQDVLTNLKDTGLDGVKELLQCAREHALLQETRGKFQPSVAKNTVIVIEGLDATGKTTLCSKLATSIGGSLLGSPPPCLHNLRDTFDAHPHLVRRAYYCLGNYITAQEIAEKSQTGPVIVDRLWHSSSAYAIATEVGCGDITNLPPLNHHIYKWPEDLLKPDVVVLLVVNSEERKRRLQGRKEKAVTEEELKLEKSELFRERLLESYKRMYEPSLDIVDASGTPDEVLHQVMMLIRSRVPNY